MKTKKRATTKQAPTAAEPVDVEVIEEIHKRAREVFEAPEPSAEAMGDLISRIESLPTATAFHTILSLAQEGGEKALPVLERLAQSENTTLVSATVEAMGSVRSTKAADLLTRIASTDPNREVRKEAKRAVFKLRSLGIVSQTPVAGPEEVRPRYPIFRSILSSFDGAGTHAVMFGIQRPLGGGDRIIVLLNARTGLTDCFGTDTSQRTLHEEMDTLIKKPEHGMLWADAPASYCQQLVHDALALNPKSSTVVPRGYIYWKNEIGQPSEHYERPIVYKEISPLEVKWDPTLLEQSDTLLDLHEFDGWVFDPEKVEKYYFELAEQTHSAIALPEWSQKERQTEVMKRCLAEIVTPEEHARYKFEMEEMAYLFLRHDRRLDARRSLAVAVAMEDTRDGDLINIPFMRGLLMKTFALFEREMRGEETISSKDLGIITPDQFM